MHILYFTAEQWPTFRPDLVTLFGKYLPRFGVTCDLVTEFDHTVPDQVWPAGHAYLCQVPRYRAGHYIVKFLHQLRILITVRFSQYQAVQVRDMVWIALWALMRCKIQRKPFFYWLSYPQSEGQIDRAKKRGPKAGMRFWFPLIQGRIGKFCLYRWILPYADHVFVQSENMRDALVNHGIPLSKMTVVPMGVDLETAAQDHAPIVVEPLKNKRLIAYLGTLDAIRQIHLLFEMLALIRTEIPNAMLLLVGDTHDASHRRWLKQEAERIGVDDMIYWTGWLPVAEAWRFVVSAEVGLSPIPRGYLLDMGSPTKAIEYMALGIPVVMNDNPDQQQVTKESGAAICVPLTPKDFAQAVLTLLKDDALRASFSKQGQAYVSKSRSYGILAQKLANKYHQLL